MERPQKATQEAFETPHTPVNLSDEEVIGRARNACSGATFSALWNGDTSGYGSHSEADLALCNMLAYWTGGNAEQADRLFRASGLMREKWDRRQSGTTYGAQTVQKAVEEYWHEGTSKNIRPGDFSDAGNAETFRAVNEGRLLFTDTLGWLVWNGQRWERNNHQALTLATELSSEMLVDAQKEYRAALVGLAEGKADEAGPKELEQATSRATSAKAYLTHAKQTRSAGRLKNMLELAKPAFVVKADTMDANPVDLNTPAGIVDLTTGELRPHDREARCSQITAVSPGEQGAQMWGTFLDTITQGDGNLRGFLQLVAGIALHGKAYHEGLILAYGAGRNGKSTFLKHLWISKARHLYKVKKSKLHN